MYVMMYLKEQGLIKSERKMLVNFLLMDKTYISLAFTIKPIFIAD